MITMGEGRVSMDIFLKLNAPLPYWTSAIVEITTLDKILNKLICTIVRCNLVTVR